MKTKTKPTQDEPLRVPLKFDEAINGALKVKPPKGGWAEYEKKLKQRRQRKKAAG